MKRGVNDGNHVTSPYRVLEEHFYGGELCFYALCPKHAISTGKVWWFTNLRIA